MKKTLWITIVCVAGLAAALRADPPETVSNLTDTVDSGILGNFPLRPEENPFSVVEPWPPHKIPVGSLRLDTELKFEEVFHRLQPPWSVVDPGCGVGCGDLSFSQNNTSGHGAWTSGFGDQLTLAMQARPSQNLFGNATLSYQTDYDNRYWLPITDEHDISDTGGRLRTMSGEMGYASDDFGLRAFSGVAHDGWENHGDLFDLYPAQWNVDKYRDFSGRQVPRGGEMMLNGGDFGRLTLEGGGEQVWGYGPSLYALYENRLGSADVSVVSKFESIPWGDPDEHIESHSLSSRMGVLPGGTLSLGILYQPFRMGRTYTHVDEVPAGQGIEGSSFVPSQHTVQIEDAFGGQLLYEQKLPVLVDDIKLRLQYLGRVAGNKKEFHIQADRKIDRDYTGVAEFTYQGPLEDPVPFVFEGSPSNQGAAILTPRGQEDPFWVNWSNREARIYAFTLTYNPGRAPFYRNTNDSPKMSNLNPDVNVPLAWAVRYQAAHYLTAIDHSYYVDQSGNYIWEPAASNGAAATSRPLSEVQSIFRFQVSPQFAVAVGAEGGESLASSSLPYNDTTNTLKPITDYIEGQIRFFINRRYTTWFRYSQDLWGPYSDFDPSQPVNAQDFQRAFGIVAQKLFEAGGEANLGNDFVLGIRYVSVRENDNIFTASDIGSFDEYRMSLSYRFGLLAKFTEAPSPQIKPVQRENAPPEVYLHVGDPLYDAPGLKARIPLHLKIVTKTGVGRWQFQVFNSSQQPVGLVTGVDEPPEPVIWTAVDSLGIPLPSGTYSVKAVGWDVDDNRGETEKAESFEIHYPPPRTVEAAPASVAAPPAFKVEESESALKVTFKSSVLFDVRKAALKARAQEAIEEVIGLIQAYEGSRLKVEGYTDSSGTAAFNARLSKERAQAVADYLVKKGVDPKRIEVYGRGPSHAVASNSTTEGRSLNRRVEITILKAKE